MVKWTFASLGRAACLAVVLLGGLIALALPRITLASDLPDVAGSTEPIVVGTYEGGLPPYEQWKNGELQGLAADYLRRVLERLGRTYRVKLFADRKALMEALRRGEVDIVMNEEATFEGAKYLRFSEPYADNDLVMISARKNRRVIDRLDLASVRVITVAGSAESTVFSALNPGVYHAQARSQMEALAQIENGDADVFVGSRSAIRRYAVQHPMHNLRVLGESGLPLAELRFAFPLAQAPLAAAFDKALGEITPATRQAIRSRWLGVDPPLPLQFEGVSLSPDQLVMLNELPTLRVSNLESFPPFSFRTERGEPMGLVEEYFHLIRQQLQLRVERVPVPNLTELGAMLERGEIDMVPGLPATEARRRYLVFSQPYARFPLVIITREERQGVDGIQSLGAARVAISEQAQPIPDLLKTNPRIVEVDVPTVREGLRMLANRQVDAYVGNLVVADRLIADNYGGVLKVAAPTGYYAELSVAVTPRFAHLIPLINQALANISPERHEQIRATWFPIQYAGWEVVLRRVLPAAIVLVAMLTIVMVAYLRLRREIKQRMHSEARAKASESRLTDVTESLPVTVFQFRLTADGGMTFPYIAGAPLETFGLSAESIMADHDHFYSLIHYEDRQVIQLAFTRMVQTLEPFQLEFRMEVKDGLRWIRASTGHGSRNRHGDVHWGGYFKDITEVLEAEQQLNQAKTDAEQAAQAKSAFLAMMSHEIRTPVHGVLGWLEVLERTPLNAQQQHILATVRSSSELLSQVIDNVLDFSKLESGQMMLELLPVDLRRLLDESFEVISLQARNKGLRLSLDLDAGLAPSLLCDGIRLKQILFNLLGNALKFTESGQIVLRAELKGATATHQQLEISVGDTGIGIAAQDQVRLFQFFEQAESSTTRRFGGTGLGLAISRGLAEQMGGSLSMQSAPGVGTRVALEVALEVDGRASDERFVGVGAAIWCENFEIAEVLQANLLALGMVFHPVTNLAQLVELGDRATLCFVDEQHLDIVLGAGGARIVCLAERPLAYPPENGVAKVAVLDCSPLSWGALRHVCSQLLAGDVDSGHCSDMSDCQASLPQVDREQALEAGQLVLVAEDHPISRELLRQQLSMLGYACDVVADGRQALQAIERTPYGLIIADYHMPYVDGYELTRQVRERERKIGARHLPIVLLTASVIGHPHEECAEAGVDGYFSKPLGLEKLRELMAHLPAPSCAPGELGEEQGFDLAYVSEAYGSPARVEKILRAVADNLRLEIASLRVAADADEQAGIVHRMASGFGLIKAMELVELSGQLEQALREGALEAQALRVVYEFKVNALLDRLQEAAFG